MYIIQVLLFISFDENNSLFAYCAFGRFLNFYFILLNEPFLIIINIQFSFDFRNQACIHSGVPARRGMAVVPGYSQSATERCSFTEETQENAKILPTPLRQSNGKLSEKGKWTVNVNAMYLVDLHSCFFRTEHSITSLLAKD